MATARFKADFVWTVPDNPNGEPFTTCNFSLMRENGSVAFSAPYPASIPVLTLEFGSTELTNGPVVPGQLITIRCTFSNGTDTSTEYVFTAAAQQISGGDGGGGTPSNPGSGEDLTPTFALTQLDTTSVMASWANINSLKNGRYRVEVALANELGQPATHNPNDLTLGQDFVEVLQTFTTKRSSIEIPNLWPGMTYWVRLNGEYIKTLQMTDTGNGLVLFPDGWHSKAPTGFTSELTRLLVRKDGTTSTVLRHEVRSTGSSAYTPRGEISREFGNLKPGHAYKVSLRIKRVSGAAQSLQYVARVNAKLPKRATQDSQIGTTDVLTIGGPMADVDATFGFIAPTKTATFTLAASGEGRPIDPLQVVESVELSAFRLELVARDLQVNDVAGQASAASYLDMTMNSVDGCWFVDRFGRVQFRLLEANAASPVLYFSPDERPGTIAYTDNEAGSNTQQAVNTLALTQHRTATKALSTDDWAEDDSVFTDKANGDTTSTTSNTRTFIDQASINKIGARSASADWCLYDDGRTLAARVASVFKRFAIADQQITSITVNAQRNPLAIMQLEVFDRVFVELGGMIQDSRVLSLRHSITSTSWTTQIELLQLDMFPVSETFADFNALEPANTFAEFNDLHGSQTFKGFNRQTRS